MNKGFKIHFHLKKPKNYTGGNMTTYMQPSHTLLYLHFSVTSKKDTLSDNPSFYCFVLDGTQPGDGTVGYREEWYVEHSNLAWPAAIPDNVLADI